MRSTVAKVASIWSEGDHPTRWTTTLSSKLNVPHEINFGVSGSDGGCLGWWQDLEAVLYLSVFLSLSLTHTHTHTQTHSLSLSLSLSHTHTHTRCTDGGCLWWWQDLEAVLHDMSRAILAERTV